MYKTIHKIRLRTRQKASTPSCALFTTKFVAEKARSKPILCRSILILYNISDGYDLQKNLFNFWTKPYECMSIYGVQLETSNYIIMFRIRIIRNKKQ